MMILLQVVSFCLMTLAWLTIFLVLAGTAWVAGRPADLLPIVGAYALLVFTLLLPAVRHYEWRMKMRASEDVISQRFDLPNGLLLIVTTLQYRYGHVVVWIKVDERAKIQQFMREMEGAK